VDLDYKGLANTGTWFIGRLQTERDKARVLEGLEGAVAGGEFDRGRMDEILAGLGKRVFLLHNVHENEPVTFQTRWVLSYLGGPMTRDQIKQLMASKKGAAAVDSFAAASPGPGGRAKALKPVEAGTGPPILPPGIESIYLAASGAGHGVMYYPGIGGRMDVHYSSARYNIEAKETLALAFQMDEGPDVIDWDSASKFMPENLEADPLSGGNFASLPSAAKKASNYRKWNKDLLRWVRQNQPLRLMRSKKFGLTSRLGESGSDFRLRLAQAVREKRDLEVEKLRKKYDTRFATLRDRLMRAEQAISREGEQVKAKKMQTAISFGTAILGAFLGRKAVSATSASRIGTAVKSASRVRKEKMDVARARERAEAARRRLEELEQKLQEDIDTMEFSFDIQAEEVEELLIKPKSTDIALITFGLIWMPYRKNAGGGQSPDWE
jgi:hypothetical protein